MHKYCVYDTKSAEQHATICIKTWSVALAFSLKTDT